MKMGGWVFPAGLVRHFAIHATAVVVATNVVIIVVIILIEQNDHYDPF